MYQSRSTQVHPKLPKPQQTSPVTEGHVVSKHGFASGKALGLFRWSRLYLIRDEVEVVMKACIRTNHILKSPAPRS